MIIKKTKQEIEVLRESGKVLRSIMDNLCEAVKPGVFTGDLETLACKLIKEAGARPAQKNFPMGGGLVFPTAIITAVNDEVVHAPALPSRELNSGDIVSIDFVIEYPLHDGKIDILEYCSKNHYYNLGVCYTDMSRTVPVGKISTELRKLLKVTKESLDLAIDQVKPGNTLRDIAKAVQTHVEANGFSVVRDLVGHGVGHSLHEEPHVPNYIFGAEIENVTLEPGMVLAIEPMTTTGNFKVKEDKKTFAFKTVDGSVSAHFEHSVAVTREGNIILTK